MASGLPNDFLSWKSFQSLTQTAALAWMVTLIIDVIFIQGIEQPRAQLTWIWIIGFTVCFILACIRLYFKEEKERGDKFMLLFNAALIFLYASGFNGFTKELGSWSEVNKLTKGTSSAGLRKMEFRATLASFVPNIFANQTAIWPDVKMMNENQTLKLENESLVKENRELKDFYRTIPPSDNPSLQGRVRELENENERLYGLLRDCEGYNCNEYLKIIEDKNREIGRLRDSLNYASYSDCSEKDQMIKRLQDEIARLRKEGSAGDCDRLRKLNETLESDNNLLSMRIDILLERIGARNNAITEYRNLLDSYAALEVQQNRFYANMAKEFNSSGGPRYVELVQDLLGHGIDVKLP